MAEAKCIVTTKDAKGNSKKFEITKDTFFIGRADTCEISLPIKGISRQHLEVQLREDSIFIKDLNSSNGTRLNAAALSGGVEVEYKLGDEIWLGPSDFPITFTLPPSAKSQVSAVVPSPSFQQNNSLASQSVVRPPTPGSAPMMTPPKITRETTPPPPKPFVAPTQFGMTNPPAIPQSQSVLAGRPGVSFPPPPVPQSVKTAQPFARMQNDALTNSTELGPLSNHRDQNSSFTNGSAALSMNRESTMSQDIPSVIRDTPSIIREAGAANRDSEARLKQTEQQAVYILQEAKIKADNILSHAKIEARTEAARVEQDAHRMFEEAEDHATEVRKTAELEAEQILQIAQKKALAVLDDADQNANSLQNKVRNEVTTLKKDAERQSEAMISSARDQARDLRTKVQTEYDEALSSARKKGDDEYQRLVNAAKDEVTVVKGKNESLYKENRILEEKRQDLEGKAMAISQAIMAREKELRDHNKIFDDKKKSIADFDLNFEKSKQEYAAIVKLTEELRTNTEKTSARLKELEERKTDFESFADKELASARAHQREELQKKRDQILVDHEKLKSDLEKELAESRRREMEKIQTLRQEEVKMMRERRHVHAVEIARAIEMFLRPLMNEAMPPATTPDTLKSLDRTLEPLIRRVMGAEETDRSGSKAEQILTASADERTKKRWQTIRRTVVSLALLSVILIGFFRPSWFGDLAKRISGDEQRTEFFKAKEKTHYAPTQDDIYRSSYAENLLYLKEYAKYKADPQARKNWVLSLNNLFIQDLGLSENLAINFVGQESAMTDLLLQEKEMIDPGFLKIGLDRMNRSEFDSIQNIRKIIVKEPDWRRIRELDHEMYREWLHR